MPNESPRRIMARLVSLSRSLYRRAIAAQVAGDDALGLWAAWQRPTSGLILASWGIGSRRVLKSAPPMAWDSTVPDLNSPLPLRMEGRFAVEWPVEGPEQVAEKFAGKVPVTAAEWKRLASLSRSYAERMAMHEEANAIPDMMRRSPRFASLVQGQPPVLKPGDVFFATGVPADKAAALRNLIADAIVGKPIGKSVRAMGLGDFILAADRDLGLRLTDARLETVLRTNMAKAQMQGEATTLKHPTVRAFVPLLESSAIRDQRTRPTHAAMSGYVGTVEEFERLYPAGFACRCAQIPMSIARAMERGLVGADGQPNREAIRKHNGERQRLIDSGLFPDPGFTPLA